MDVYAGELKRGGTLKPETRQPALGLVAVGVVELRIKGKKTQRVVAGGSFSLPGAGTQAVIVNASSEVPAKVISFRLN